jgi:hypothetical protein
VNRKRIRVLLAGGVILLFVAGAVWGAFHPNDAQGPDDGRQLVSKQDGYYLCLHRPKLTAGEMYKLIRRKLPQDDQVLALEGCQAAQK